MRKLIAFIVITSVVTNLFATKSPHGEGLKMDCNTCHQTDNWKTIKEKGFNHNNTDFPLDGQHLALSCKKCHQNLVFSTAKKECNSCHIDVHQGTVGQDCERCHAPASWMVQNVNLMHAQSRFPLRGVHANIDCNLCHTSASMLRFDPMKSECFDCHSEDFSATTNPNHIISNFPKDCSQCHDERDWNNATFNHDNTAFPLTGAHFGVDCLKCHTSGYNNTSTACVSCHQNDYNATTNPNHVTAQFSTECTTCHNEKAWIPSTFDHNTATSFLLKDGHLGVDCIQCHASGYNNTSTACVSCHQNDFNATTNPNHVTAQFSTECTTCHNEKAWIPSTFDHNTATSFPLKDGHLGVDCIQCHTSGYNNTSTACVSCHQNDFNATTNPNHTTAQFSTECTTCHNETAWIPSTFDHNTATSFPLKDGHLGVDCIQCHAGGYNNTSSECASCHQDNYNATTNPNHTTAQFSTECTTCHNEKAWIPSTFDHNTATSFPLKDGHLGVDCIKCHASGYNNTSMACVSCHQNDFNATTNPNHVTAQFPTECTSCHNERAWTPSTFNHDSEYFPIYSGKHQGEWTTCTQCHTNASNFTIFSCITCHEHNKTDMDNDHSEEKQYVYNSSNCLACHPRGEN